MITNLDDNIDIKQLADEIVFLYREKNYAVERLESSLTRQKIRIKKGAFRGRDLTIEMERKADGLEIRIDKEKLIGKMIPGAVGVVELFAFLPAAVVAGGTLDTAVATASSTSIITDILATTSIAAPVLVPVAIGIVLIGVTAVTFMQQNNFRKQVFLDIEKLIFELQQTVSLRQDFFASQNTQSLQQKYSQRKILFRIFCLCAIFVLFLLISIYLHLIPQEYSLQILKLQFELGKALKLVEDQIAGSFWVNAITILTFIITIVIPFAKYIHAKRDKKKA